MNMHQDLQQTIDRLAQAHCGRDARQAAEGGEWPAALWQALDEVGLAKAALPEAAGGSGLEFGEAMYSLRRTAYHALPVPLAETMLAHRLLTAAGMNAPEGAITVAFADGKRVPWGNQTGHVLVAHQDRLELSSGLCGTVEKNLAGEPRVALTFGTPIEGKALPGAHERLRLEGALLRSVQMAGALERILEYSLAYANERVQFGRPIGKFQAVQHMLALLAGHVAAASAAVEMAVDACAAAPDEFAVAVAKARVGEAAGKGAEIAHQVHGAMGFTHEHNLHFSTRRLWSWRDEFGNESYWQARLGRAVAAAGPAALWPRLTR